VDEAGVLGGRQRLEQHGDGVPQNAGEQGLDVGQGKLGGDLVARRVPKDCTLRGERDEFEFFELRAEPIVVARGGEELGPDLSRGCVGGGAGDRRRGRW
jgi:hypothetical protein